MIVLDANIVVRAVLGRRVRELLENYSSRGIRFFAPEIAFEDAAMHLPVILARRASSPANLAAALEYFKQLIEPVERDFYKLFEEDARMRLRGRDEDDWPVLAVAIGFGCPVWTEDADFFGTGVAVWTTNRVEIYLRALVKGSDPDAEE